MYLSTVNVASTRTTPPPLDRLFTVAIFATTVRKVPEMIETCQAKTVR